MYLLVILSLCSVNVILIMGYEEILADSRDDADFPKGM